MKVKISYTVEVSEDDRGAIAHHFGLDGLADHEVVRNFYRNDFDLAKARASYFKAKATEFARKAEHESE